MGDCDWVVSGGWLGAGGACPRPWGAGGSVLVALLDHMVQSVRFDRLVSDPVLQLHE